MDETDPRMLKDLRFDAEEIYAKNEEKILTFLTALVKRTTFDHVRLEERANE